MTRPTPETLRDRVAAAIKAKAWGNMLDSEASEYADAVLAAIPKLSPEARETLLEALDALYEDCEYRAPDCLPAIAKARAELQALP